MKAARSLVAARVIVGIAAGLPAGRLSMTAGAIAKLDVGVNAVELVHLLDVHRAIDDGAIHDHILVAIVDVGPVVIDLCTGGS